MDETLASFPLKRPAPGTSEPGQPSSKKACSIRPGVMEYFPLQPDASSKTQDCTVKEEIGDSLDGLAGGEAVSSGSVSSEPDPAIFQNWLQSGGAFWNEDESSVDDGSIGLEAASNDALRLEREESNGSNEMRRGRKQKAPKKVPVDYVGAGEGVPPPPTTQTPPSYTVICLPPQTNNSLVAGPGTLLQPAGIWPTMVQPQPTKMASPTDSAALPAVKITKQQLRRYTATEEEKQAEREKNKLAARRRRLQVSEEKKQLEREKNRLYQRLKRERAAEEEKDRERERARLTRRRRRAEATEEEREAERERARETMRKARALATEAEREAERERARATMRLQRALATEDQKEAERERARQYQRAKREKAAEEKRELEKEKARLRRSHQRAQMTEEQRAAERERNRIEQRRRRERRSIGTVSFLATDQLDLAT